MRILFVNVVDRRNPVQVRHYPLAFGYLVSYCYANNEPFEYAYTEKLDETCLKNTRPDVVAMTSVTENYNLATFYSNSIKKFNPNLKVIIGGIHISVAPTSLSRAIDVGVIGEGEATFLELLKNNFEPNDKIKGIVYRKNDILHKTEDRNLIDPLDSIPHPKRDMFGNEKRPQIMFTTRGCSYRCIFCSSSRFWKKVRFHSPEYVATEINQIKERFNVTHIGIADDTFILDIERVRQIKDLVKPLGLRYSIEARANLITEEVATILKDMGVKAIGMGFESNSQRILDYLHKGNTVEDNQRAVNILRKYGIKFSGSFIRNIPIETPKDLKLTYDFIHKNAIPYDMYNLQKYPGTPIYEGNENWDSYKVYYYDPKMMKLRKRLFKVKPLRLLYRGLKKIIKGKDIYEQY